MLNLKLKQQLANKIREQFAKKFQQMTIKKDTGAGGNILGALFQNKNKVETQVKKFEKYPEF